MAKPRIQPRCGAWTNSQTIQNNAGTLLIGNGYASGHADLALDVLRGSPDVRRLFEERLARGDVEHLLVKDDQAVVELRSLATAKNGMRFDNYYCWVVYFKDEVIVKGRVYLISVMVTRLFAENPIAA